ncbi:MAG: hypothetical protein HY364_03935 [Candidatus Aenigmarchaeota archaeon]|nr:hypothetical protein [Candidatus Aenigmarchaeota archaeon]
MEKKQEILEDAQEEERPLKDLRPVKDAREIQLLEQGYVPKLSKTGEKFKGKNKIIIG